MRVGQDHTGMGTFYRSRHELIFVFKAGRAVHRNNVQLGRFGRDRTNVWNYPDPRTPTEEGNLLALHPTVKPVALVADAIMDCSARGDIVLDAFLGSGTTLIAAQRTGRRCYGLELDPLYVDTIVRRWQAFTRDTPVGAPTVTGSRMSNSRGRTASKVGAIGYPVGQRQFTLRLADTIVGSGRRPGGCNAASMHFLTNSKPRRKKRHVERMR